MPQAAFHPPIQVAYHLNVLCNAFPREALHICNYLLAICLMLVLYFSLQCATLASMLSQDLKEETFITMLLHL